MATRNDNRVFKYKDGGWYIPDDVAPIFVPLVGASPDAELREYRLAMLDQLSDIEQALWNLADVIRGITPNHRD